MNKHGYRLRIDALEDRILLKSPSAAPPLPPPPVDAVWVDTLSELYNAVDNLQSGQTVVIQPGTYNLTRHLGIGQFGQVSNVTIRGETSNFYDVVIRGAGGWEDPDVGYGFYIANAQDVTIADLSVGEVYYHAISLEGWAGADRVRLYHTRIYDTGEQHIKGNPGGSNGGTEDVTVEYCLIEYTNGTPPSDHGGGTGYVGAAHVHNGIRWTFRDNLIRDFHTPDSSFHWFAPTLLFWNYSRDTVVERNTLINTDRAIAYGLIDKVTGHDHEGGVIRDNFVVTDSGLFSPARRAASDGQIIVWDSPGTFVAHNTMLSNLNQVYAIELRWTTDGIEVHNNLTDAPIRSREGFPFTQSGNYTSAVWRMFVDPANADLHLAATDATRIFVINKASPQSAYDWDRQRRTGLADIGADEFSVGGRSEDPNGCSLAMLVTALDCLNSDIDQAVADDTILPPNAHTFLARTC